MDNWWKEAGEKSKLRTYTQVTSRDSRGTVVKSNVKRYHGSILCKLLAGILPLEIELGCFINVKEEDRTCKVCNLNRIEDESHFLFCCGPLQLKRSSFYIEAIDYVDEFLLMNDVEQIAMLLQPDYIKKFGYYVAAILRKRQSILYKPTC